ncbi:MAG: flagellar biosynthetic protein FliO [Xanthobacteraceae bacterium]
MGFFGGMPFPVQFFLAFIVVLGLIGATAWAVRRFGTGRLGGSGLRGRQPRLAVVDYASVDARRRLLLIRRDNVEHLIMIGGPTDVVVESNIVRAAAAPREMPVPRSAAGAEALPRPIALPDSPGNGSWTQQPEPAAPPNLPRLPRPEAPVAEPADFPLQPQAEAQRPHRDTLAALADELSTRPAAPPARPTRPQTSARPYTADSQLHNRQESRPEPRLEVRPETRSEVRPEPRTEVRREPRVEPRIAAAQPPTVQPAVSETAAADQSLAEMAQRLEAALRKPSPKPGPKSAAPEPRAVPTPRDEEVESAISAESDSPESAPAPAPAPILAPTVQSASASPARQARAAGEMKSPRADTKQPSPGKSLYDSLEQEMASLLGRPTVKH